MISASQKKGISYMQKGGTPGGVSISGGAVAATEASMPERSGGSAPKQRRQADRALGDPPPAETATLGSPGGQGLRHDRGLAGESSARQQFLAAFL